MTEMTRPKIISNSLVSEDILINMLQTQKEEKEKVNALEITKVDHERRIIELVFML